MVKFWRKRIADGSVVALVLALAGCGGSATPENASAGTALADTVVLEDVDGRPFEVGANAASSAAMVLVFTRSDCPISNRYAPTVRKLCDDFHGRGVKFVLVYVDPRETAESARKHLAEFGYPCPAVLDPRHALATATGARVTPEAVVLDPHGKMAYRGRIDDLFVDFGQSRDEPTSHDLADAIEATLAGQATELRLTDAVGCLIGDLK